jgi:hypothetical protein
MELGRRCPSMLKDGVVLAVICLIVVGGIFAWWIGIPMHSSNAAAEPQVQTEPVPAPAPAIVKKARLPHPDLAPVVEQPVVLEAAPSPQVSAAVPVVQPDPPPFPAVEQIATGVREAAITGKFGDPVLSAVTSTRGHMVETFVYARGRGHSATIIRLEDGKVVSSYSQTEPVLPPGLSAPRRWHN